MLLAYMNKSIRVIISKAKENFIWLTTMGSIQRESSNLKNIVQL
jgi:hypothetical protein